MGRKREPDVTDWGIIGVLIAELRGKGYDSEALHAVCMCAGGKVPTDPPEVIEFIQWWNSEIAERYGFRHIKPEGQYPALKRAIMKARMLPQFADRKALADAIGDNGYWLPDGNEYGYQLTLKKLVTEDMAQKLLNREYPGQRGANPKWKPTRRMGTTRADDNLTPEDFGPKIPPPWMVPNCPEAKAAISITKNWLGPKDTDGLRKLWQVDPVLWIAHALDVHRRNPVSGNWPVLHARAFYGARCTDKEREAAKAYIRACEHEPAGSESIGSILSRAVKT